MDTDSEAMGTAEPTLRDVVAATIRATVINRWTHYQRTQRNGRRIIDTIGANRRSSRGECVAIEWQQRFLIAAR